MARRTKAEARPSPYEVDTALAGTKVRIKGEQGVLTIHSRETNPRTGCSWFVLFREGYGWRHKYPADVSPVKRGQSLDR